MNKRDRYQLAREWTPRQFLAQYARDHSPLACHRMQAADYLYGMETEQVKELTCIVNDLVDDLARHRKRLLAMEQLTEAEQLAVW